MFCVAASSVCELSFRSTLRRRRVNLSVVDETVSQSVSQDVCESFCDGAVALSLYQGLILDAYDV